MSMEQVMKAIVNSNLHEAYSLCYFAMERRISFEACIACVQSIARHLIEAPINNNNNNIVQMKQEAVGKALQEFVEHLHDGKKLGAIKAYRDATRCELRNAKDAVEGIPGFDRAYLEMNKY